MYQFIAGQRVLGEGGGAERISPITGQVCEYIDYASDEQVDAAVNAAKDAFPEWSGLTPAERSTALLSLAAELDRRAETLANTETEQTGKSVRMSTEFDVPGTVDNTAFFAGAARNLTGLAAGEYGTGGTSFTRREAIGVVGSIAPWNYPLQMAGWKILPAIAAGNTIVLKPSEMTPGTAIMFAEAARYAGIPDGVVNVVTGPGLGVGERLVAHPDVAMVSFTGSTAVGRTIMNSVSARGARVHLELGGKAPFVVFGDADIEAAAHGAVAASTINGGQDCTAATRAIVHRSVFQRFTERVAFLMNAMVVGDPRDDGTDMGSLISQKHRDRVAGFVDRAVSAGATVLAGGRIPNVDEFGMTGELVGGAFYRPTLISDITTESEVWCEEIFGPVLVAIAFDDDDEAFQLAADTPYGLAASAWTRDLSLAMRASAELMAGCVWINEHIPIVSEMPHGGRGASGFGKDMSMYSFEEYTFVKHVSITTDAPAHREWQDTVFRVRDRD